MYTNYGYALIRGSWLIYDHYLTIHTWDLAFDRKKDKIEKVSIWVRLLGLPIQLYNEKFLTFVGNKIEKKLKVDVIMEEQPKGKYARICVEIDLNKLILSKYSIKGKTYKIEYESMHMIYFLY